MAYGTIILLTGVLCASACALLGSFLILRRMAMMSDAISHAILPGLVFGYFVADGPNVITGAVGATGAALLTVLIVQVLERTKKLDISSSIGMAFAAMFAFGTILISRFFSNVHLDTDAILYGNIEFSSFDRFYLADRDLGPSSFWIMGALLLINLTFLLLFYKELKLTTFDPGLAAAIGFTPWIMHYALMTILSITAVGAFSAVGAILVVALIIVPAATAYLLTDRLPVMIVGSVAIGALSATFGYYCALWTDASVSGFIATWTGIFFALALLFSPTQGIVAQWVQRRRHKRRFAVDMLLVHLLHHSGKPEQQAESTLGHIGAALHWTPEQATRTIDRAKDRGFVEQRSGRLMLTSDGQSLAQRVTQR
jgi:manganese/zinc/iron transport system permease protein